MGGILFFKLFIAAVLGLSIQLAAKSLSMRKKSKVANERFTYGMFFVEEAPLIVGAVLCVALLLLVFGELINPEAFIVSDKVFSWWIFDISTRAIFNILLIGFISFGSYSGMDLVLRIFGFMNKRLNKVIDIKTNIADNVQQD